jgi:hypothetical protein
MRYRVSETNWENLMARLWVLALMLAVVGCDIPVDPEHPEQASSNTIVNMPPDARHSAVAKEGDELPIKFQPDAPTPEAERTLVDLDTARRSHSEAPKAADPPTPLAPT